MLRTDRWREQVLKGIEKALDDRSRSDGRPSCYARWRWWSASCGKPVSPLAVDDSPDPACRARRAAGRMAWTGISRTSTRTKASKSTVKSLPDRAKAPRPGLALEPRQPGADQRPVIEEVEVPPARAFSVIDRTGLAALQADCVRSRAAWKSSSSSSAAISCWDGRLRRQQVRTPPRPYPRIRQGARPIDAPPAP